MQTTSRRRSCEMNIPLPVKLFCYDSQSSSSCSSTVSPADFAFPLPPRNTNPILNDPQFNQYIYSPSQPLSQPVDECQFDSFQGATLLLF
ncbi:hypothetical protein ENUP19_0119G0021 [Entamoeba nuttalli]|uniref:Uncharacterized protein n=2 Tax=Entamoeba nuttalli TaxID=412467 RepID=K2H8U6_ENTNP|nr:hypothetical protein ENU1_145380 [Entamoeba nuttalli P19]EKE38974.1 hypothetical protein ENU1_145380 [Entamoeba nuttalli P19]|eukprot:XP_008858689.1 hypothetical protein ENU1_145380 [Entamoeba nuttalli P19]